MVLPTTVRVRFDFDGLEISVGLSIPVIFRAGCFQPHSRNWVSLLVHYHAARQSGWFSFEDILGRYSPAKPHRLGHVAINADEQIHAWFSAFIGLWNTRFTFTISHKSVSFTAPSGVKVSCSNLRV